MRIMPTCITLKRCSNSDKGHCFQADKKHAIPSKELCLPQVPQSVNRGMWCIKSLARILSISYTYHVSMSKKHIYSNHDDSANLDGISCIMHLYALQKSIK